MYDSLRNRNTNFLPLNQIITGWINFSQTASKNQASNISVHWEKFFEMFELKKKEGHERAKKYFADFSEEFFLLSSYVN